MNSRSLRRPYLILLFLLVLIAGTTAVTAAQQQADPNPGQINGRCNDDSCEEDYPITDWNSADKEMPLTYKEWRASLPPLQPFTLVEVNGTTVGESLQTEAQEGQFVLALVNDDIYDDLVAELTIWRHDLEREGWTVEIERAITTIHDENAPILRDHLRQAWQTKGLNQVLLVGDFPIAWYEDYGWPEPGDEEHNPFDFYYMDLDGIWIDVAFEPGQYERPSGPQSAGNRTRPCDGEQSWLRESGAAYLNKALLRQKSRVSDREVELTSTRATLC